jgi:hypothetical protein
MSVRFVKFNQIYVNPARVLSVNEVYSLGEINLGGPSPIKTGLPVKEVIRMLEEALNSSAEAPEGGGAMTGA